jgi:hypothetical protein
LRDKRPRIHGGGHRRRDERNVGAPLWIGRGYLAFDDRLGAVDSRALGPELGLAILAMASMATFTILKCIGVCSQRIGEKEEELNQKSVVQAKIDLESRVFQRTAQLGEANAGLRGTV